MRVNVKSECVKYDEYLGEKINKKNIFLLILNLTVGVITKYFE